MLSPRVQSSVIFFTIDGEAETLEVWSDESALRALQVRHSRARFPSSCEQGLCGTCEVLLDGQPTRICLLAASRLDGTVIELPTRWTAARPTPP
jgi:aerobic-type carbon monoxide dehydrogenase small subunit (CoxS/CutS family)